MSFELIYGYCHCFGRTTYRHGLAASEEEARRWVQSAREDPRRPVPADSDPVWTCPVAACPGHRQRPWFAYRPVPGKAGRLP